MGSGFNLAMQDLDIRGAGNLLGAEQSGFMEDLGYETYQKILNQAVTELKNDEFPLIYADELAQGHEVTGDEFVDDCAVESDLEVYFPDTYVPGSSERMLLYRELDNIVDDRELASYRQRLVDRFGAPPHSAEELMRVVPLRRTAQGLGCEKVILKQKRMTLYFVSQNDSPFYQSEAFDHLLAFVAQNPRRCQFRESNGHRSMVISDVPTIEAALQLLKTI